jgi:hypothetical protein
MLVAFAAFLQLHECIANCIKHLGNRSDDVCDETKVSKGTLAEQV